MTTQPTPSGSDAPSTPVDLSSVQRLVDLDAIRTLQARFDDATIRRDEAAFRTLWAADPVWEIDPPLELHAQGIEAVMQALDGFNTANEFFFRMTGYGVITLDGDRARATVPTVELARRDGVKVYSNVAIYQDELVRENGAWLFAARRYYYIWVDTESPLPGQVVPLPPLTAP